MLLRTKIFRQLVLFALAPSVIMAGVAYYFLLGALDRTSGWIATAAPDRTINSLRMAEARLQQHAGAALANVNVTNLPLYDTGLDWMMVIDRGEKAVSLSDGDYPPGIDTVIKGLAIEPGPVRFVSDGYVILGWADTANDRLTAGGYLLDREYLDGLQAATFSLTESRRLQTILPWYMLFLAIIGAIVMAVIVILAYLLSRRFSRSITTPLENLTTVTAAVARGDFSRQLSAGGTEEVARLTETFNRMMADLDDSRRRLIDAERVAAWQEFARRMAHELKNPLTPISLSLYRIRKSLHESGQYDRLADSFEAISAEVSRLERLANDYSSLAQLPAPKMTRFEFTHLVRDLISLHRTQLDAFSFTEQVSSTPISLDGDPDHLQQVMVNLLKNAMEFTSPGDAIVISVEHDDRSVRFSVANQGRNVDEGSLRAAKMPYFSTRQGGSGLGLAVSEKIIVDHHGSLDLYLKDGITVARFEIPRRQAGKEPEYDSHS